ncbi:MAG: HmuY family protein [Myxococcota bacterium]
MNHKIELLLICALALPACGDDSSTPGDGDDDGAAATDDTGSASEPATSTTAGEEGDETAAATEEEDGGTDEETGEPGGDCTDQMIQDLGLVEGQTSAGVVGNTADGDGFASTVDATAGGITMAPQNPWLYLRFTAEGLEKVDVDDLQALESADWDIAAKRFGIRLNGGVSGPSTVSAAALEGTAYEDVTELPEGTELRTESFYDAECNLIDDGSGQGSPGYELTPWWGYNGCVNTTGTPFVLELADGSHVKLVVDAYYMTGQQECNETGSMGMGSANFAWRWAYLQ